MERRERTNCGDELAHEVRLLESAIAETFDSTDTELILRALRASLTFGSQASAVSVRVARLLLSQHADAAVIAAVLLAPVKGVSALTALQIETSYGGEIARLVEEAQRISPLALNKDLTQHEKQADLLRSTVSDLRLLIARVATRIIDLEMPTTRTDEELRKLAWEGRELLVPLADRVGLGLMRGRLEDACFRILEPQTYASVRDVASKVREADDVCLQLLSEKVALLLTSNGIAAEIQARTKSLWGLYCKMRDFHLPIERIMDRLGARVIVASVPECYTVLGLLHRHFRPIPGTFRDYIGLPKENGYQSLHSCVYPLREISAKAVEFQIRTKAMHSEAEFGAAAHWLYKSREEGEAERSRQRRWLEEVASVHAATIDHALFVERLKRLAYEQSLVVFLRGGEQVCVPSGSTAADVVNKLSEHASAISVVRINAEQRPLGTPLVDGDTIEWDEGVPEYLRQRMRYYTKACRDPITGAS